MNDEKRQQVEGTAEEIFTKLAGDSNTWASNKGPFPPLSLAKVTEAGDKLSKYLDEVNPADAARREFEAAAKAQRRWGPK